MTKDKGGAGEPNEDMDERELDELQHGCHKEEFKEVKEVIEMIKSLPETFHDQVLLESTLEKFIYIVDQYQEQPHLLDPHLADILELMLSIVRNSKSHRDLVHLVFRYMYYVTKTRGFKVIIRLMPHEVVDLEPILNLLQEQNLDDAATWETRYMLLVWLSIVCMIPFDLDRLNQKQGSGEKEVVMMDRIFDAVKPYLGVFDKSRDAANYLVARFLTRPDVKERRLESFTNWAMTRLDQVNIKEMSGMYWIYGIFNTFGLLFKHGKREDLLTIAPTLLSKLTDLKLMESNPGLRKLHIKVIQRLGLGFLKPRLASWRYQRGNRSLADNLGAKTSTDAGTVSTVLADDSEGDYDIPEELESIIEELLGGLKDKDTIVRWSAAKGMGRLSGRLPKELADEVLASILELFSELATDEPWHGGCLALAELGRRGLLLPERLDEVIPIVLKALNYDEKRGNFSVGSHVRDAACYVCWAFARAYDPREIAPYVQQIACALVICSILDRDINVRRAAAAAFQENVGRQGQFPHGIDILTTCDYFAVGSRRRCYNDLSLYIGQYEEYILPLVDHIADIKLVHWDTAIRQYSATALENLCTKADKYLAKEILPRLMKKTLNYDLAIRHGATLGLGHVICGLSQVAKDKNVEGGSYLSSDMIEAVQNVVQKQTDGNLYKGISGAAMRQAASRMIQKCAKSGLKVTEEVVEAWRLFLEDCLYHITLEVRVAAVEAYSEFLSQYYTHEKFMPFMDKYLRELTNSTETTRQGYALAVGQFPKKILQGSFRIVTNALMQSITSDRMDKKHAEARRDAVIALNNVCTTVGVSSTGNPQESVCESNINDIYETLFHAIRDYTIDAARGDVGSYVREASMDALTQLTSLTVTSAPHLITPPISTTIFCQLLQQGNEKIGRTRAEAGENFIRLLHHEPQIPHVPDIDLLKKLFPGPGPVYWDVQSQSVSLCAAKLLSHPVYVKPVLMGFVITVGGLTEYLLIHTRAAILTFLREHKNDRPVMDLFTNTLLEIFEQYARDTRVTIPALKMLDQLLDNDCLSIYAEENEFPLRLLTTIRKEMQNSGDPTKLLASVDVYCGMIQFSGEVRKKSLFSLMMFLCHKYPRIRKKTANKLYETLLMYDEISDNMDEAMVILSETLWDNDIEEVRPIRNNLCDVLGIAKPIAKAKK